MPTGQSAARLGWHRDRTADDHVVIAILAGWTLGRLNAQRWVEPFAFETKLRGQPKDPPGA
jgi:hypothetical protein